MPLYTYACHDHGQFAEWASMADSDAPCACPSCAAPAPRALARPAIAGLSGGGGDASGEASAAASPASSMGGCGCTAASCMH